MTPVKDNPCFYVKPGISILAGNILWEQFQHFELTEIMRQKGDIAFAEALNALGCGDLTEEQLKMFRSRIKSKGTKGVLNVFHENNDRHLHNEIEIRECLSKEHISQAIDTCLGNANTEEKDHFKKAFQNKPLKKKNNLVNALKLKVGIRYYIVTNINNKDGISNGASGKLMEVSLNESNLPLIAWIKFDNERVGQITKAKESKSYDKFKIDSESNWIPIRRTKYAFADESYKTNIILYRDQFPLEIGEGSTIHKVQGSTFNKIVVHTTTLVKNKHINKTVDFYTKTLSRQLLYVACSRATTLEGLMIVGEFKKPPKMR